MASIYVLFDYIAKVLNLMPKIFHKPAKDQNAVNYRLFQFRIELTHNLNAPTGDLNIKT